MNAFLIAIGLFGLIYSSDKFIAGASGLSINFKISPMVIGIIVIGLGTSAPEIFVSASAAFKGSTLAIGNVIGSNISNIALIIATTAIISPIKVNNDLTNQYKILIATSLCCYFLLLNGFFSRIDALVLLFILVSVLTFYFYNSKKEIKVELQQESNISIEKSIYYTLFGMVFLIASSKLLVYAASDLARTIGVNETIIGLTIVSIGTSLPELSACIMAAKKGNSELALGNVIGSNIFNISAALAVTGMIYPHKIENIIILRDLSIMLLVTFLFYYFSFKENNIKRKSGYILIAIYVFYLSALGINSI